MINHGEIAEGYFMKGYNCTQSVVAAFCEEMGLTEEEALKMSAGFGGGFSRLREVCGTFSGVVMVISALYGNTDPKGKSAFYAEIQSLAEEFKERNGKDTIVCRSLLGLEGKDTAPTASERTADYYKRRPCKELVRLAAEITEEYIQSHPIK